MGHRDIQIKEEQLQIEKWLGLLADPGVNIKEWVIPQEISTDKINIAGARVPVLSDVKFKEAEYDYYALPL